MPKFKPKAEQMFEQKLADALERRDMRAVERVMHQYGCYLELIDPNVDLSREQVANHSGEHRELISHGSTESN